MLSKHWSHQSCYHHLIKPLLNHHEYHNPMPIDKLQDLPPLYDFVLTSHDGSVQNPNQMFPYVRQNDKRSLTPTCTHENRVTRVYVYSAASHLYAKFTYPFILSKILKIACYFQVAVQYY